MYNKKEEKWTFSLNLPFADRLKTELVTTFHEETSGFMDESLPSLVNVSSEEDATSDSSPAERRSLLEDDQIPNDHRRKTSCWKFTSPQGHTLESSILLKLSYRPAWQGIPEYTRSISRQCSKCCFSSRRRTSFCDIEDDEQIWEIYSTKQIVKTERREIFIRGMGPCQAIHVFLKPFLFGDGDEEDNTEQMNYHPPNIYRNSYNLHKDRMGKQPSNDWTRFSRKPDDSLPTDSSCIILTFAVPTITKECKNDPPLLWKADIPQIQSMDVILDTISVFDGSVDLKEPATHAYINGYQSWSFTGSVKKGNKQPKSAMPNKFSKAFNHGGLTCKPPTMILPNNAEYNGPKENPYKSDFYTCITTDRDEVMDEYGGPALVVGWLSQHEQLGIVTMDDSLQNLDMQATHGAQLVDPLTSTDWAYAQLVAPHYYDEEPLAHFLHATAAFNEAAPLQNGPISVGWCSWYHYYENISEGNLRENFSRLASMKKTIATNLAVVDDGFMTAWGDWDNLKPGKFTDMRLISRDIEKYGMRPGLWLAPFAADKHSMLVQKHPEWIIRNDQGLPANSSNCGKFFYGLDATNPQVRKYVFDVIRRAVKEWGFHILKIDFLYAACLEGNGKYDLSMTRAQAMHLALQTIREAAGPDVFLIGCGCPIGVAIGYVDGMRVSADTGPTWYPTFPLPWWDHSTLPSLRAMIRNSLTRSILGHRWWHNDPDCLQMGKTTSLTNEEVISAASIVAMTCGMMLLSDDLSKLGDDRMRILTKIYPMTGVSGVVLDLHCTNDNGMPSIVKLWCTDIRDSFELFHAQSSDGGLSDADSHNLEATYFALNSSYDYDCDEPVEGLYDRNRNCIHVAKGLGTWTVISLSNWKDLPRVMTIPHTAIEWKPPEKDEIYSVPTPTRLSSISIENGWHLFSFWSERYSWISSSQVINDGNIEPRLLGKHETEIFHIKAVTPGKPQYIGSSFHFSCGLEVFSFDSSEKNKVMINLRRALNRSGYVYLFVPTVDTSHVRVFLANAPARWSVFGSTPLEGGSSHCCGRIIKIEVVVRGDGSDRDGEIVVEY